MRPLSNGSDPKDTWRSGAGWESSIFPPSACGIATTGSRAYCQSQRVSLLVTLPQWVRVRTAELEKLEGWVERGNTLLIMAAINDTPLWSLDSDPLLNEKIEQLTGLRLEKPPARKAGAKLT